MMQKNGLEKTESPHVYQERWFNYTIKTIDFASYNVFKNQLMGYRTIFR